MKLNQHRSDISGRPMNKEDTRVRDGPPCSSSFHIAQMGVRGAADRPGPCAANLREGTVPGAGGKPAEAAQPAQVALSPGRLAPECSLTVVILHAKRN